MTARASNRFALLAAERMAPFQLQLAAQQGQREALRHAAGLSALDKLIAGAGAVPGMVESYVDREAAREAQDALARLQGRAGEREPLNMPAEGPSELVQPPLKYPEAIGGVAAEGPGERLPAYEREPATVPGGNYFNRNPYDEAVSQVDEALPSKSTGQWWDVLVPEREVARRARSMALLPASKEVAATRKEIAERERKAAEERAEAARWQAGYEQRNRQIESNLDLAAAGLGINRDKLVQTAAEAEAERKHADEVLERKQKFEAEEAEKERRARVRAAREAGERKAAERDEKAEKGRPLPQSVLESLAGFSATGRTAARVTVDAKKMPAGRVEAGLNSLGQTFGVDDPKVTAWRADLASLAAEYQKAMTGAGASEAEARRLISSMPTEKDAGPTFAAKMEKFQARVRTKMEELVGAFEAGGFDVAGVKQRYFSSSPPPVEIFGAEQGTWAPDANPPPPARVKPAEPLGSRLKKKYGAQ